MLVDEEGWRLEREVGGDWFVFLNPTQSTKKGWEVGQESTNIGR